MNDSANETDTPALTVAHVATSRGLLGILKDVGNSNMMDPEKYHKVLQDTKDHYTAKQADPNIQKPRHLGGKLGHHLAEGDYEKAATAISGHPLTGLVGKTHLKSILQTMAPSAMGQDTHPAAFRGAVDYLSSATRGKDLLDRHIKNLVDGGKTSFEVNNKNLDELKKHLDHLSANPSDLLDVGGNLGHYLPDHGVQIASLSGNAVSYLNSLKPMNAQESPFDKVLAPSKAMTANYDRQVNIAQNPMLVLQHAKDGTLLPTDIATIQTIYPALHKSIVSKIGEQIIDATTKGVEVPYKMRSSLSMLLGQALDSTMTSKSMQAIMASAQPRGAQGPQKSAPATTLKAADKANAMLETPQQARLINRKQ